MVLLPADRIACDQQEIPACVSFLPSPSMPISVVKTIALKSIGHFSDAHRAGTILCSDPPEIVSGLIPFVGMMLVLWLMHKIRAFEQGRNFVDGQSQMINRVAIGCAQPEECKSCSASSAAAEAAL